MNNKCINLKQKFNQKLVCKKTNKEINIKQCNNCIYKEYKKCTTNLKTMCKNNKKHSSFHSQSAKLRKLERNRFSILTNDLDHCIICGAERNHLHEVFQGAYRQRSIKEKMVLPLCVYHHTCIHNDIKLSLYWKRTCQKEFEKTHTRKEFIKIFGRSYLQ